MKRLIFAAMFASGFALGMDQAAQLPQSFVTRLETVRTGVSQGRQLTADERSALLREVHGEWRNQNFSEAQRKLYFETRTAAGQAMLAAQDAEFNASMAANRLEQDRLRQELLQRDRDLDQQDRQYREAANNRYRWITSYGLPMLGGVLVLGVIYKIAHWAGWFDKKEEKPKPVAQ
jgi:hypothetical protein